MASGDNFDVACAYDYVCSAHSVAVGHQHEGATVRNRSFSCTTSLVEESEIKCY